MPLMEKTAMFVVRACTSQCLWLVCRLCFYRPIH